MKSLVFTAAILVVFTLFSCGTPRHDKDSIQGKWESLDKKGLMLYFRADGSCDGFRNGKIFTTGYYELQGDTIKVREPNRDSYAGIYQLEFKTDQVIWHVLSDTLGGRSGAMDGNHFVRKHD